MKILIVPFFIIFLILGFSISEESIFDFPNAQGETLNIKNEPAPKPSPYYSFKCTTISYKNALLDSTGFVGVYDFAGVPNFVLKPGGEATLTYNLMNQYGLPERFENYTISAVLENNAVFYEREDLILHHYEGNRTKIGDNGQTKIEYFYSHQGTNGQMYELWSENRLEDTIRIPTNKQVNPGVQVTFEPKVFPVEKILKSQNNSNGFIAKAIIQVDPDATKGTYWLSLNENPCKGTPFFLFTIGDSFYRGDKNQLKNCPFGYPHNFRTCFNYSSPVFFQNNKITKQENDKLLSPIKQLKNGVEPIDIICKFNYQLIFKISDNSPGCFKQETFFKLIERDWSTINFQKSVELPNNTLTYDIIGGKIEKLIESDLSAEQLVLPLTAKNDGILMVILSENLDNKEIFFTFEELIVLLDGEEVGHNFVESKYGHLLIINFEKQNKEILIYVGGNCGGMPCGMPLWEMKID